MKNSKMKRVTAILLTLLLMFSTFIPAFGLSSGDDVSFSTKYTGVHYDIPKWTMNGHTHSAYGEVALRNLSDGTPVYCLEPYHSTEGSSATATLIEDTDAWKSLDYTARRGVTLVSIWGYPNHNYGKPNDAAQFATQILIWEFVSNSRNDYTSHAADWATDALYDYGTSALEAYAAILDGCISHNNTPNFGTTSVTVRGVGERYGVTLTDKNGVLSEFKTLRANDNISYSVSGNKIKVWALKSGNLTSNITFTKRDTDTNSCLALTGANQTMLYGTIADPVYTRLNVNVEAVATLKVQKVSEDGNIQGLKFVLGATAYRQEAVTDANGVATFTNIPVNGNQYYISEEFTDEQAVYLAPFKQTAVNITEAKTYTYEAKNILKRGNAEFIKTDETTGDPIVATDATFEVQQWSESAGEYVNYKTMAYSADTGKYEIKDLVCTKDNMAKFRIVEVSSPSGYQISDTVYEFTIQTNGETVQINNGVITNAPATGTLVLTKTGEVFTGFEKQVLNEDAEDDSTSDTVTDEETATVEQNETTETTETTPDVDTTESETSDETEENVIYKAVYEEQNIPGAVYRITAAEDIVQNGVVLYKAGETVREVVTEETPVNVTELPLGKYNCQEVSAPPGYVISDEVFSFELTHDNTSADIDVETITAYDVRQKVVLDLTKEMQMPDVNADPEAYKNVVFGIYAKNDITNFAGETVLSADTLIDYITIDENGKGVCTADLPVGFEFYIKEVETDSKYILDTGIYEFSTVLDNQDTEVNTILINNGEPIVNSYITGYVEFKKVDEDNASIELEAVYGVFTKDGKLIEQKTSKIGDWVRFEGLPVGDYYLQEIEQPNGYLLSDTKYDFSITPDSNGETIQIIAKDTIAPTPEIPETGIPAAGVFAGVCAIVLLSAGIYFVVTTVKKKKTK